jgi:NAD(P)-dependent dehydrogenase (short-subunit alcohol dehydrogenase family)
MLEFKGKVAVITGAASGIGRSIAERCALEGMKLVLADVEQNALAKAELELRGTGAAVLAVRTDVSKAADIEALARAAYQEFGAVHLLFNNAGVGANGSSWESSLADWEWVMGVNLWGVIHGIRTFVPLMLEQDCECTIVNTASIAGLISGPGLAVYKASKHAVVSLSETLSCELTEIGAKIKVSVLCPMWVKTQIFDSDRNRPAGLQNPSTGEPANPNSEATAQAVYQAVQDGISPSQVADDVFNAIRDEKFYILTHPESKVLVKHRMEAILQERNPS